MSEATDQTPVKAMATEAPNTAERSLGPPRDLPAGQHYYLGTGRRKKAVARVRLRPGSGQITVNGKPFDTYFCVDKDRLAITRVLSATDTRDRVDVFVNLFGGGTTGQSGAVVLGLARALRRANSEYYDSVLRDNGFLTRDSRQVERKKYGQAGARRRFQFSKR
jgi:small subunit ribosomal protein S9